MAEQPPASSSIPQASPSTVASPQASSPFTPPQISLPAGGGAIRGIGEKFTANPVIGTGKLTLPLPLSPGRTGFGPQLSLSYDSGSGNGPFGFGGALSSQAITCKTDKGLPKYRRQETGECDVFVLSGAEDLVPALVKDECGKWRHDEFEHDGYHVKRYRPRIEGLFARIERWRCLADGDEHWRSISRDNSLAVYGRDATSRIFDPSNPRRIFSWLICESYDDKGNAVLYEYVAENGDGVDLQRASEHRRVRTANRYLKRIRYGNRQPILVDAKVPGLRRSHLEMQALEYTDWLFEVVFDYGEGHYRLDPMDAEGRQWVHCTSVPSSGSHWPVRKDPHSTYRSGFEVRTYRLCQRVLMFHHFPDEALGAHCLVRSTEFEYRQNPTGSFITRVTQSGYTRHSDGRYLRKSMPPLELDYTSSPLEDPAYEHYCVRDLDETALDNLPAGIDGEQYAWVDLYGEGISGVLNRSGTSWHYKPNAGLGRLGPTKLESPIPSIAALRSGTTRLLDLEGNGSLDLVTFEPEAPGFQERTGEHGWGCFWAFRSLPVLDFNAPNLRFVDLTGDGIADILITEDDALTWHPSHLAEGFGSAIRVAVPADEHDGPHVIFDDGEQSIYLADMTGDGLSDLVRIRQGEVCYWSNQGYGRFGPKVIMDNAPWFEDDDLFDHSRVKLSDTDGSGTTDIVYLAAGGIRIYLNEAGNSWSSARVLREFAPANRQSSVAVVDLLGRGTACLLWSSMLPANSGRQLRYLDLMDGRKPHLLVSVRNNLGAETRIEYASSTEFYLADKAAGTPWLTRLPFPVHVVKRVETYDYVSRNRFVSSYTYHHGFFDPTERELRGWGRVDELDTEELATLSHSDVFPTGSNIEQASNIPPILTKTWFHTGVFLGNGRISRHLAHEYYREPVPEGSSRRYDPLAAMLLDDTILPETESADEAREACRALKGTVLRQEVYALDDTEASARPYTVMETNSTVVYVQPRRRNLHPVFFTHPRETISFDYERKLYDVNGVLRADPRVSHTLTLEVDNYGNVLKSASIGYGRRFPDPSSLLNEKTRKKQHRILATYTEHRVTNTVAGLLHAYRTPAPAETRSYELVHIKPSAARPGLTNLFRFEVLRELIDHASDGRHELAFEDVHARGAMTDAPYRRLIDQNRTYYRADRLDRLLSLGEVEALALPGENYQLALSPDLIARIYRRGEPAENLIPDVHRVLHEEGGYVDLAGDGRWWAPSGRIFYAIEKCDSAVELGQALRHFFRARRFVDPFGNPTTTVYDRHDLLPIQVRDAIGNTLRSQIDYRVLATSSTIDANQNRAAVAFDALGMVVGTAVMGKSGERAGDSLEGFDADLAESVVLQHLAEPLRDPGAILKLATTRVTYDVWAFLRSQNTAHPQPAAVYTLSRETHVAELSPGENTRYQHAFSYSDGFGREIQSKRQAELGQLSVDGQGALPRWIGSGWTIFNNKGKPVRRYEPFFSRSHAFEFAKIAGVSPILFYDPLQRNVATLHPNHSYEKVAFDPWHQLTWDVNDTVLQEDASRDPDVGVYIRKLTESDYLPAWYAERKQGSLGREDQEAAIKAAAHANTPNTAYFDPRGRTFLSIDHNRIERAGTAVEQFLPHQTELDIEGRLRFMTDALGRVVARCDYDMLGICIREESADAGTHWMLNDVTGKPLLIWDSRSHRLRHEYDNLRRPTNLHVRTGNESEFVAESVVYGEGQSDDVELNLRGKPCRELDGAGVVTHERYDFKGNLLRSMRQLLKDYKHDADWAQAPELQPAIFRMASTYDALNRVITATTPDGSVAHARYNEMNRLQSLSIHIRGAVEATPVVVHIGYDPKGQRQDIEYGNGVCSHYEYDPPTLRMIRLLTHRKRDHACLQDLHYVFDPVGNISSIRDEAQQTVYFRNQAVSPNNSYVYDAMYRLISADGREHAGVPEGRCGAFDDVRRINELLPADGRALRRYRERYDYDGVGNILRLLHEADGANWSRHYSYADSGLGLGSDRLTGTRIGQHAEFYEYDASGNTTRMPHLAGIRWDFKDRLRLSRRQSSHSAKGETTYYLYDSKGERVRKVIQLASGSVRQERVYLGTFEIYRKYGSAGACVLECETLHVTDDKRRVALFETTTTKDSSCVEGPRSLLRLQINNYLESCAVELDASAEIISHEEYFPYGSTSYHAADRRIRAARKRYRFIGKERDRESGFYYHGARYYAPWLGRWTSPDPTGMRDGTNLYAYGAGNPVTHSDPTGTASGPPMPDPYLLESGGSAIIGDYEGYNRLWNEAVDKVLPSKWGKNAAEKLKSFEAHINKLAKEKGLGSNRAKGTARNVARRYYSKVRSQFGKLAKGAGVPLTDVQVHHGIGQVSELHNAPQKALDAGSLHLTKGNASTPGTGHNRLHELNKNERLAAFEAKNAEKIAAKEGQHAAEVASKFVGSETKEGVKLLTKESETVIAKTAAKEALNAGEKTGLKAGAKFLGTKAAKFVPFVGIGVGVGLAANDLRKGDYKALAWDVAEAIPVVGDVVGAFHGGLEVGTALNEGLGIEDVAAEHGAAVESAATSLGISKDTARLLGATEAAVSSITVAPIIALNRKISQWLQ